MLGLRFPIILGEIYKRADAPHPLRLLCARRKRPSNCRATEKRDELAPSHASPEARDIASYRLWLALWKGALSALGQKQTYAAQRGMSALPRKRTCAVSEDFTILGLSSESWVLLIGAIVVVGIAALTTRL